MSLLLDSQFFILQL